MTLRIALLVVIVVATPTLAVGGKFSTRKLNFSDLPMEKQKCICLYIECYPEDVKTALKKAKMDNKICTASKKDGAGEALAITEWDSGTGQVLGIAVFDLPLDKPNDIFGTATPPWLKKSSMWQEGNRLLAGNFYPVGGGAIFGLDGAKQCYQDAYAAVNNALTHARDAASRSTFAGVTDPGPDAAGNDNITEAQWCAHVANELMTAETRIMDAEKEKATAKGKRKKLAEANKPTDKLDTAIKELCKEIDAAKASVAAAKAKKAG